MSLAKPKLKTDEVALAGLFSKKEAAEFITQGSRHVHSSLLGKKDPLFSCTHSGIISHSSPSYPWELISHSQAIFLSSSTERKQVTTQILSLLGIKPSSSLGDRLWTSLEEILSNSMFQAYHNPDVTEKYSRKSIANLLSEEKIKINFNATAHGVFFSVTDCGQGLSFEKIQQCFKRCYHAADLSQIETKTGGAGLVMYVILELATHLKIISNPKLGTRVSCWLSSQSTYDPDTFSFNFYEGALEL